MRHRAFTLIELMVVVSIIAVLVAILSPTLSLARASARKSVCATRLRQSGIAIAEYVSSYQSYPPFGPTPFLPAPEYAWNICLRSASPEHWRSDLNQIVPGRIPAKLTPWSEARYLDTTAITTARLYLPDGTAHGAQAIHPQEINDTGRVAQLWDSCDPETAPAVDKNSKSVEALLPGARWGPHSQGSNGYAVLNGSRHPNSPNVLYADGSVRADATQRLKPAASWNCPAGTWKGLRANSWPDWTDEWIDPRGKLPPIPAVGTMHHIIPRWP